MLTGVVVPRSKVVDIYRNKRRVFDVEAVEGKQNPRPIYGSSGQAEDVFAMATTQDVKAGDYLIYKYQGAYTYSFKSERILELCGEDNFTEVLPVE